MTDAAAMTASLPLTALGLMSGTSLDGVDAAIVKTDGTRILQRGPTLSIPYDEPLRQRLRAVLGGAESEIEELVRDLTLRHADAVHRLLAENGIEAAAVDVIGFHGQTIRHCPAEGITRQIGDGALLAERTGIAVVDDFRGRDVASGGEGAPLAPLYHAALAATLERPVCVLNLGGVANLTWIGDDDILAFDTGPGGALLDDWVVASTGQPFDADGALARAGSADGDVLVALLDDPYFDRLPPKSLDRNHFDGSILKSLSPADGAATLVAFTATAVARAARVLPQPPRRWLVCGGGRRNPALLAALAAELTGPVETVESVGWDGDALEAQAFAFLAVRSLYALPLSLPTTTGVPRPTTGGILHRPSV